AAEAAARRGGEGSARGRRAAPRAGIHAAGGAPLSRLRPARGQPALRFLRHVAAGGARLQEVRRIDAPAGAPLAPHGAVGAASLRPLWQLAGLKYPPAHGAARSPARRSLPRGGAEISRRGGGGEGAAGTRRGGAPRSARGAAPLPLDAAGVARGAGPAAR